jgi:hypothetical protein
MCDRWWTDEEYKELGIDDEVLEMTEEDFFNSVDKIFADIKSFKEYARI